MPARRHPVLLALVALGLQPASPAAAEEPLGIRVRLEMLGQRLERSVSRVSRPGPAMFQPQRPQAIHVSGLGVVLILPARMLPRPVVPRAPSPPVPPVPAAPPPRVSPPAPLMSGPEPAEPPAPPVKPLEQLERDLQRELAVRAQLLRDRARFAQNGAFQRAIDLQMHALHEQAEAFRQEAQRAREQAEREIRTRLKVTPPPSGAEDGLAPPEAAPWGVWLEASPPESRSTEQIMAQVREAIVESLPAQAKQLQGLDPRESITVAVDFFSGFRLGLAGRARRTLVVRVPIAEIEAVAAGRLTPAEFRVRVQAREY